MEVRSEFWRQRLHEKKVIEFPETKSVKLLNLRFELLLYSAKNR